MYFMYLLRDGITMQNVLFSTLSASYLFWITKFLRNSLEILALAIGLAARGLRN